MFESKLSLQTSEIVDNFKPAAKDLLGEDYVVNKSKTVCKC